MAQAMDPEETIFVQTDPAFNIVLEALKELRNQNRLQVIYFRTASLKDIESDNVDQRFVFGGVQAFARTASSVLRMCMLEATNIRRKLWPRMGKRSQERNSARGKLSTELIVIGFFNLADTEPNAIKYWSKYDQLYPHFLIEQAIQAEEINTQISLPSMMIVFRNNFREVIEITTTFNATQRDCRSFDSYIHITCIVRLIKRGIDKKFTKQLKEMAKPIAINNSYFEKIRTVKEVRETKHLPDALDHMKIVLSDTDDSDESSSGSSRQ